jgi:hypothetical protein
MTRRYPTSIRFGGGFRVDCATASRSVDTTVREHWARARKVDIHGNDVAVAEDSPLSDAEWAKHHHSLATMALRGVKDAVPNAKCLMRAHTTALNPSERMIEQWVSSSRSATTGSP